MTFQAKEPKSLKILVSSTELKVCKKPKCFYSNIKTSDINLQMELLYCVSYFCCKETLEATYGRRQKKFEMC